MVGVSVVGEPVPAMRAHLGRLAVEWPAAVTLLAGDRMCSRASIHGAWPVFEDLQAFERWPNQQEVTA